MIFSDSILLSIDSMETLYISVWNTIDLINDSFQAKQLVREQ